VQTINSWTRCSGLVACIANAWLCGSSCFAQTQDATTNSPHQSLAEKVAAEDLMDDKSEVAKLERKEAERKRQDDDMKYWTHELDPLPNGGWSFRHYADDWSWALYTSNHQRRRVGDVVTLWLRWEHRDSQSPAGHAFRSYVEKVEFDCNGARMRTVAETFYAERNLKGNPHSLDLNPKSITWDSVIPGSQGEYNLQYACGNQHS
jgi:hypothetical protein